jgi:3-oxoacyl-[acyl-carrier protein] reductase
MLPKKTVLITGASRGIGKATAELFAEKGWNVLINYLNSEAAALTLRRDLNLASGTAEVFKADVSKRCQVERLVAYGLERFGDIDVLVNNAGLSQTGLFGDFTEQEWDAIFAVNLKGVFNCCQSVLPVMLRKKRGKIINVSSIWGIVGASCEVPYSAAKAGVIGLTKALAKELGPSNIQVNCVAPGIIETEMLKHLSPEELAELKSETPLQKIGQPRDVAGIIAFLASAEADFITGQVISPNGGFVI